MNKKKLNIIIKLKFDNNKININFKIYFYLKC